MTQLEDLGATGATLVDAIDHLLNRGVVLTGHTTISVAGVDLVYLGLNLLLSSVETLERGGGPPTGRPGEPRTPVSPGPPPVGGGGGGSPLESDTAGFASPTASAARGEGAASLLSPAPEPYSGYQEPVPDASGDEPVVYSLPALTEPAPGPAGEERPERGLARLVLALVELLRQLLERQAVRRMEGDSLPADAVERMGLALMELEAKMAELRTIFDLTEEDLTLDLGPLGRLA